MVATALPNVTINGYIFAAHPNPSLKEKNGSDRTSLGHVIEWLKTSNAAYRLLSLLEKITKVASIVFEEMDRVLSDYFSGLAKKFGTAAGMLGIPRLPDVTKKAWEAITDWSFDSKGPLASVSRTALEKTHDVADALACWLYSGSMVLGDTALKNAADIPNLVADVTDVAKASSDWKFSMEHLNHLDAQDLKQAPLYQRFTDAARGAFLRLVKAVASVVSGVIGLLVLSLGGPILSPLTMLCIGLTSTTAAIAAHFFKETRSYLDIDKAPQAEVLIEGQVAY